MTWDTTTPLGSESILNGDNRIRELKTDIQTALRGNAADGDEAKFPGSDTANPVFRYRGLKGTTAARPTAGQYGLYMNETLNTIQRDNGSAWVDVATLIPSGTKMAFYQASPPVGWTAVAVNDKFMRVVTSGGTGGTTGGTVAASTSLAHTHTTGDFTLTTTEMPAHTHAQIGSSGDGVGANNYLDTVVEDPGDGSHGITSAEVTGSTGSGAAHNHGVTGSALGAFAYADFCVGTKD